MAGLIDAGMGMRGEAMQGMNTVAGQEIDRINANQQYKNAYDAQKGAAIGQVAGGLGSAGLAYGLSHAGEIGAALGLTSAAAPTAGAVGGGLSLATGAAGAGAAAGAAGAAAAGAGAAAGGAAAAGAAAAGGAAAGSSIGSAFAALLAF